MIITHYNIQTSHIDDILNRSCSEIEWDIGVGIPEDGIIDLTKFITITSKKEFVAIHRSFHDIPKCKFGIDGGICGVNTTVRYYGDIAKFILANLDAIIPIVEENK